MSDFVAWIPGRRSTFQIQGALCALLSLAACGSPDGAHLATAADSGSRRPIQLAAGIDAGTDSGQERAGIDAGTDSGQDIDAGTDSGQPIDAGTDSGPPLPSCFGTVQAGACQCTVPTSCQCDQACFSGAVNTGVCCRDAPALVPVCRCSP